MQRKLADSEFGLTGQKLFLYLAANVDHLEQKWPFWPPLLSLHTDEDYCNWHSGNQLISKESNIGQYSICFIRTMCLHESDLWRKLGVLIKFPDHWKIDLDRTIYCEQLILCLKLKLTVFIHYPSIVDRQGVITDSAFGQTSVLSDSTLVQWTGSRLTAWSWSSSSLPWSLQLTVLTDHQHHHRQQCVVKTIGFVGTRRNRTRPRTFWNRKLSAAGRKPKTCQPWSTLGWVCDDFGCHSFGGWDAPVKEEEEVKIEENMPALLCLDGRRTDWVDL